MKTKTKEQLETEMKKIRADLAKLEAEEINKTVIPGFKKLVGTCWVYRNNSYSCPKTEKDYWNVYRKIIGYSEAKVRGFHFIIEEFSTDSNGKVTLLVESAYPYPRSAEIFTGFVRCEEQEYLMEKARALDEMASQTKIRAYLAQPY